MLGWKKAAMAANLVGHINQVSFSIYSGTMCNHANRGKLSRIKRITTCFDSFRLIKQWPMSIFAKNHCLGHSFPLWSFQKLADGSPSQLTNDSPLASIANHCGYPWTKVTYLGVLPLIAVMSLQTARGGSSIHVQQEQGDIPTTIINLDACGFEDEAVDELVPCKPHELIKSKERIWHYFLRSVVCTC